MSTQEQLAERATARQPRRPGEAVRLLVVGLGRLGRRHAEMLSTRIGGVEVVAVADADGALAAQVASDLRIAHHSHDYRTVLNDRTLALDGVIIVSPTDTHTQVICDAAAAGVAIFCEKPIALELADTERALAAVRQADVPLQIGFQRRFDRGYQRARELVARGDLGRVHMIKATARDPQLPPLEYLARSGGIFRDMTIHDIDILRFLSGEEIVEVSAVGAVLVDPQVGQLDDVDTTVLTVRFASGALGVIDNSRRAIYGYDVRTEVFGPQGAIVVEQARDIPITRYDASGVSHDHVFWFLERFQDAYLRELEAFVSCIRDGQPPTVDGEDGRRALLVALAADASLRAARPVRVQI